MRMEPSHVTISNADRLVHLAGHLDAARGSTTRGPSASASTQAGGSPGTAADGPG
jgi:hypothetical protein